MLNTILIFEAICNAMYIGVSKGVIFLFDLHLSIKGIIISIFFCRGKCATIFFLKKKPTHITHSTCQSGISQEIKVQQGQLRYQSIDLIQMHNLLSFHSQIFILTDVAGLQSEKKPKRGTKGSGQLGQEVPLDPKILFLET